MYDRLLLADLVEHLQHTPERHDLVVAADVFIYVGELDAVFGGVVRVLRPRRRVLFLGGAGRRTTGQWT